MKPLERILQKWRMSKALRHVPIGSRLLDIGCFEGEFFQLADKYLRGGVGIEPNLRETSLPPPREKYHFIRGSFPADMPSDAEKFDVISVLAVFEHIPGETQRDFIAALHAWLNNSGLVILTVPSPFVDNILAVLLKLHLIDGMQSLEEHHGLSVKGIPDLFRKNSFTLLHYSTFQMGLNNLFVFQKEER